MTLLRSALSALLWVCAAHLCTWAVAVAPRPIRRVLEVDGATLAEAPREQILAPPAEWSPGLTLHAAFAKFHGEARA